MRDPEDGPVFRDQSERRLYYRELGLKSLYHFVKIFGSPVKQGGDISPITHRAICEFISDDDIKRKGVAMPRKLRKTTICDRWYPIWCYLRDHEERILLGAETLDIASASMDWIKNTLLGNELLRWCYPEIALNESYTNRNKWSGVAINLPRDGTYAEPTFKALGVGGAGQSRHFSKINLTDIFGEKGMNSEPIRLKTISWWENLPELLVDGINGIINLDFTFWAVGDPHQFMMDTHPEYHWRIVPALKVDEATAERSRRGNKNCVIIQHPDADLMDTNFPDVVFEPGEKGVVGSSKFPTSAYKEMMANKETERLFWTQHMNMPESADSTMNTFMREWLRRGHIGIDEAGQRAWFCDDGTNDQWTIASMPCYGFIDPGGFAENPLKGGRCAAMIVGPGKGGRRRTVVYWTWAKRVLKPSELVKAIFDAHEKFRPRCWRVEVVGQQAYILRSLQEESQRQMAGLHLMAYEIKDTSEDAKHNRIIQLKGPGENGEIYITPEMTDFAYEWAGYPVSITKDLVDCASMYWSCYGAGAYRLVSKVQQKNRYRDYLAQKTRAFSGR